MDTNTADPEQWVSDCCSAVIYDSDGNRIPHGRCTECKDNCTGVRPEYPDDERKELIANATFNQYP